MKKNYLENFVNFYLQRVEYDANISDEEYAKIKLHLMDFSSEYGDFQPFAAIFSDLEIILKLKDIIKENLDCHFDEFLLLKIMPLFKKIFSDEISVGEEYFKQFIHFVINNKFEQYELKSYLSSFYSVLYRSYLIDLYKILENLFPNLKKDNNELKYLWSNFYLLKYSDKWKEISYLVDGFFENWTMYFSGKKKIEYYVSLLRDKEFTNIKNYLLKFYLYMSHIYNDEAKNVIPSFKEFLIILNNKKKDFASKRYFLSDLSQGLIFDTDLWVIEREDFNKTITIPYWNSQSFIIKFLKGIGLINKNILQQPKIDELIKGKIFEYLNNIGIFEKIILLGFIIPKSVENFLKNIVDVLSELESKTFMIQFVHLFKYLDSIVNLFLDKVIEAIKNSYVEDKFESDYKHSELLKNIIKDLLFAYPVSVQRNLIDKLRNSFNIDDIYFLTNKMVFFVFLNFLLATKYFSKDQNRKIEDILKILFKDYKISNMELYEIIDFLKEKFSVLNKLDEVEDKKLDNPNNFDNDIPDDIPQKGMLTKEMVAEIEETMPQEHPERIDIMEVLMKWTTMPDKLALLEIVNSNPMLMNAMVHDEDLIHLIENSNDSVELENLLENFSDKTNINEFKNKLRLL